MAVEASSISGAAVPERGACLLFLKVVNIVCSRGNQSIRNCNLVEEGLNLDKRGKNCGGNNLTESCVGFP